jgi:hypothetical protein
LRPVFGFLPMFEQDRLDAGMSRQETDQLRPAVAAESGDAHFIIIHVYE